MTFNIPVYIPVVDMFFVVNQGSDYLVSLLRVVPLAAMFESESKGKRS